MQASLSFIVAPDLIAGFACLEGKGGPRVKPARTNDGYRPKADAPHLILRHSRESGNPVMGQPTHALGPRFCGDDENRERPQTTPKPTSPLKRPFLHYRAVPARIRLFSTGGSGDRVEARRFRPCRAFSARRERPVARRDGLTFADL